MTTRSLFVLLLAVGWCGAAEKPTDNPLATYYDGDRGYPAWTDRIRRSRVIDRKVTKEGRCAVTLRPAGDVLGGTFEGRFDDKAVKGPAGGRFVYNPQTWGDFLAPPDRKLRYRVVAINSKDTDEGASPATGALVLAKQK